MRKLNGFRHCLPLVLLLASPALAKPTEADMSAARVAEAQGERMFAYDQAAWLATDAFRADAGAGGTGGKLDAMVAKGLRGYVVEPQEAGVLLVSFYGERSGKHFTLARYAYAEKKASGALVDGEPALSPMAERLVGAREAAIQAMTAARYGLCTSSPPNTLVLPNSDSGISVYIMSSATSMNAYPAGGHYRFDFDASGAIIAKRGFMKSCMPIDMRPKAGSDGSQPVGMYLTHILDPQPTEIHAFLSKLMPTDLMIATVSNKAIWSLHTGKITYLQDVKD